jgi:hypothetical protein
LYFFAVSSIVAEDMARINGGQNTARYFILTNDISHSGGFERTVTQGWSGSVLEGK